MTENLAALGEGLAGLRETDELRDIGAALTSTNALRGRQIIGLATRIESHLKLLETAAAPAGTARGVHFAIKAQCFRCRQSYPKRWDKNDYISNFGEVHEGDWTHPETLEFENGHCDAAEIHEALFAATPYALPGDAEGLAEVFWHGRKLELSVIEWAQERLENTKRLAAQKDGTDREGWLEDAHYWELIVAALASPVGVWYPCGAKASAGAPLRDCPIHGRKCFAPVATQEQPAGSGADGIDPSHDWRNILGLLKSTIGLCSDEEPHQAISANLWHAVNMIYVLYGGSPRKVGEDGASERIWCMECGKSVSTPVPKDTIVRAWVQCPECIEKGKGLCNSQTQK